MRLEDQSSQTSPPEMRLHMGGVAAGTVILTASGLVPVEDLSAGDRIVTRDAGMQQIAMVSQRFMDQGALLRVSPAAVGRPAEGKAVVVAPTQRLILRDWRARAMFERDTALVPAQRLVDGEYVQKVQARNARVFSLHFDALRIVYSGEIELGSATPVTHLF